MPRLPSFQQRKWTIASFHDWECKQVNFVQILSCCPTKSLGRPFPLTAEKPNGHRPLGGALLGAWDMACLKLWPWRLVSPTKQIRAGGLPAPRHNRTTTVQPTCRKLNTQQPLVGATRFSPLGWGIWTLDPSFEQRPPVTLDARRGYMLAVIAQLPYLFRRTFMFETLGMLKECLLDPALASNRSAWALRPCCQEARYPYVPLGSVDTASTIANGLRTIIHCWLCTTYGHRPEP